MAPVTRNQAKSNRRLCPSLKVLTGKKSQKIEKRQRKGASIAKRGTARRASKLTAKELKKALQVKEHQKLTTRRAKKPVVSTKPKQRQGKAGKVKEVANSPVEKRVLRERKAKK